MNGYCAPLGAVAVLVGLCGNLQAQYTRVPDRPADADPAGQVPVAREGFEQRSETVMSEKWNTVMHESQRTLYYPVTEYAWEPRWHGWLNPFRSPHLAYHLTPRVRWQTSTETIRTPVTYRQYVPETRVVQTPIRRSDVAERTDRPDPATRITRRLPNPTPPSAAARGPSASLPQGMGGIQLLSGDPPRSGPQTIPRHGTVIR